MARCCAPYLIPGLGDLRDAEGARPSKHDDVQEGVGPEPVRPVHRGAGGLSGREEARDDGVVVGDVAVGVLLGPDHLRVYVWCVCACVWCVSCALCVCSWCACVSLCLCVWCVFVCVSVSVSVCVLVFVAFAYCLSAVEKLWV